MKVATVIFFIALFITVFALDSAWQTTARTWNKVDEYTCQAAMFTQYVVTELPRLAREEQQLIFYVQQYIRGRGEKIPFMSQYDRDEIHLRILENCTEEAQSLP